MLSLAFERTYDELLALLGSHCAVLPSEVCLHWPMHQPSYEGRLLVIGQALNGWMVEAPTCNLPDGTVRAGALAKTRGYSEAASAFDWMRPRVRSRPFWKLAHIAMGHYGQALGQIAWSNLAKVAPAAGMNSHRELLWSQHRLGGDLLRQEVEELDPAVVLVVSGRGYAEPFVTRAGYAPAWDQRGALEFDGELGGRRWIVVSHPGTFAHRFEASRAAPEDALLRS